MLGDHAYDAQVIRQGLRARHILSLPAMPVAVVVERTFAWLNQFRRLRVRYDKRADIHAAFLLLGCALICLNALRKRWATG